MRKYILLTSAIILCYITYGQESKPTGGCAYSGDILQFLPAPLDGYRFINRSSYSIKVLLDDWFQRCQGTITIKLNDIIVGERKYCYSGEYTIPIDLTSIYPGTYVLTYNFDGNWNGHKLDTQNVCIINTRQLGIAEVDDKFELYPNPASDMLRINSPERINEIRIVNTSGQLVYDQECDASEVKIPVAKFPDGIYILQMRTDDEIMTRKILISH